MDITVKDIQSAASEMKFDGRLDNPSDNDMELFECVPIRYVAAKFLQENMSKKPEELLMSLRTLEVLCIRLGYVIGRRHAVSESTAA